MRKAKCPACKKVILLDQEFKVRELINCPHCNTILEIVKKFPPTLDWADDPMVYSSRKIFNKL
jgi:DNA-directed RNA polymerase subunit RPC12/RpoP